MSQNYDVVIKIILIYNLIFFFVLVLASSVFFVNHCILRNASATYQPIKPQTHMVTQIPASNPSYVAIFLANSWRV